MNRDSVGRLVKLIAAEKNPHALIAALASDARVLNAARRVYEDELRGGLDPSGEVAELCRVHFTSLDYFLERLHLIVFTLKLADQEADYYQILELDSKASQEEIKTAFRRLSLQYHPDRNPDDPQAVDRFREIHHAYRILSHDKSRSEYDRRLVTSMWVEGPGEAGAEEKAPFILRAKRMWPLGGFVLLLVLVVLVVDFQNLQSHRYYEKRRGPTAGSMGEGTVARVIHPVSDSAAFNVMGGPLRYFDDRLASRRDPSLILPLYADLLAAQAPGRGPRVESGLEQQRPAKSGYASVSMDQSSLHEKLGSDMKSVAFVHKQDESAPMSQPVLGRGNLANAAPESSVRENPGTEPPSPASSARKLPLTVETTYTVRIPAEKAESLALRKSETMEQNTDLLVDGPTATAKEKTRGIDQKGERGEGLTGVEKARMERSRVAPPGAVGTELSASLVWMDHEGIFTELQMGDPFSSSKALAGSEKSEKDGAGRKDRLQPVPEKSSTDKLSKGTAAPARQSTSETTAGTETTAGKGQEVTAEKDTLSVDEIQQSLQAFLNSYAAAYERKNAGAFFGFFQPDALENGESFKLLKPLYRENFGRAERIDYGVKLIKWNVSPGGVSLMGSFRLAVKFVGEAPSESRGSLTMDLTWKGSEFKVKRLDYSFH